MKAGYCNWNKRHGIDTYVALCTLRVLALLPSLTALRPYGLVVSTFSPLAFGLGFDPWLCRFTPQADLTASSNRCAVPAKLLTWRRLPRRSLHETISHQNQTFLWLADTDMSSRSSFLITFHKMIGLQTKKYFRAYLILYWPLLSRSQESISLEARSSEIQKDQVFVFFFCVMPPLFLSPKILTIPRF